MKFRVILLAGLGLAIAFLALGSYSLSGSASASGPANSIGHIHEDPSPSSITLSTTTAGRDSGGNLTYDATVTITGVQGSGEACHYVYGCHLALFANLASGGTETLRTDTLYGGGYTPDPYSDEFSSSKASAAIVSVFAEIWDDYAPEAALTSSNYTVNDPVQPEAITLTVSGVSRDSTTGDLKFSATAIASDWNQPGSVCDTTYGCDFSIYGTEANGSVVQLGHENPNGGNYGAATEEFDLNGPKWVSKIVSMQATMSNADTSAPTVYSNVVTIPDPYVTKSVTLSIASIEPDGLGG